MMTWMTIKMKMMVAMPIVMTTMVIIPCTLMKRSETRSRIIMKSLIYLHHHRTMMLMMTRTTTRNPIGSKTIVMNIIQTMKSIAVEKKSLHVLFILLLLLLRVLLPLMTKTLTIHYLKIGNENTTPFKNMLTLILDLFQFKITRTNRMVHWVCG